MPIWWVSRFWLRAALAARELIRTRRLEAVTYPFIGITLGVAFTFGLARNLVNPPPPPAQHDSWDADDDRTMPGISATVGSRHGQPALGPGLRWVLIFGAVIMVALLFRLYRLSVWPEWDVDELAYAPIAANFLHYGTLSLTPHGQPFLWHPPFYFLALSRWYAVYGTGVTSARVLGVLASVPTFSLIGWWLYRRYGQSAALFATTLIAFDGWMLYVQRISWIENLLMPFLLFAMVWYSRALQRRSWNAYVIAGVLCGIASVFNHDGAIVLLVILVHWALVRRDGWKHTALLGCAAAVVVIYGLAMARAFPGVWWQQTYYQWLRVTYRGGNHGSIRSPVQFIQLFATHYWLFGPSVIVALAGVAIVCRLTYSCIRARSVHQLGPDLLLAVWAGVSVLVLGLAGIRYAQYFVLALIPLYMLAWVTAWRRIRRWSPRNVALFMFAVVLLGVGSSTARFELSTNAFSKAADYIQTQAPHSALVATSAPFLMPPNPTCLEFSKDCLSRAEYIVDWDNFTQALTVPAGVPTQKVASYRTFSGSLDIFKVSHAPRLIGVDVAANQDYSYDQTASYGKAVLGYIRTKLKATAAGIVWDECSPGFRSDAVAACPQSLSVADVGLLVKQAKADHLAVQLRPLIRVGSRRAGTTRPARGRVAFTRRRGRRSQRRCSPLSARISSSPRPTMWHSSWSGRNSSAGTAPGGRSGC